METVMTQFTLPYFLFAKRPTGSGKAADSVTKCTLDCYTGSRKFRKSSRGVLLGGENPIVGTSVETPPHHRNAHCWPRWRLLLWENFYR